MGNYFNSLSFREKLIQLQTCKLISKSNFSENFKILKGKKIVIIGCGSQGLNQGLNMRDSGLDVSYVLRNESIKNKNFSWQNAVDNGFVVGAYKDLIPYADLVINLAPDKQHQKIVDYLQNLMKKNSILGFSHGFNIIEVGQRVRKDITVIMVAPKCPGTEVREEYKRNFGVPTLISVHSENDPNNIGLQAAKEWVTAIGGHRAGVLYSSFSAEVKSDLMGEQTILCGLIQTASILCYNKLLIQGHDCNYSGQLVQFGWEVITEALKQGGISLMLDRLSNTAKIRACVLSDNLKTLFFPLFRKHMDDIISGVFSRNMMLDWNDGDKQLIAWRKDIQETAFEKYDFEKNISILEHEYFENGLFMVAIIKAGVELAFEVMVETGITQESAYYESLHELPLIANTIARKRLYEMNLVISDTAEYGSYLFYNSAVFLLTNFMNTLQYGDLGNKLSDNKINNTYLNSLNTKIRNHPIEIVGKQLRSYMTNMKSINIVK